MAMLFVGCGLALPSYLLAVALATWAWWKGKTTLFYLSCFPGVFGALLGLASILSTLNEAGLLKNLPDALMGFLTFLAILVLGGPVVYLLGFGIGTILKRSAPPPQRRKRRRKSEETTESF
jgi:hypothetical protein